MTGDKMQARRVSRQKRIWQVLELKVAGETDRRIAQRLTEDPDGPPSMSYQQVNRD